MRKAVLSSRCRRSIAKGLAVRVALKRAKRNTLVNNTGRKYLASLFAL